MKTSDKLQEHRYQKECSDNNDNLVKPVLYFLSVQIRGALMLCERSHVEFLVSPRGLEPRATP